MNTEWRTFLEQAGVRATTDLGQLRMELATTLNGNICCNLSHLGMIRAHGPDSATFLQGQLTCDVQQVSAHHSVLGAYCSPKGRALACLRLFKREQTYYLELPQVLVESTITRLRKYVLRAKIELQNGNEDLVSMGIAGPATPALLSERLGLTDGELTVDTVLQADGITLISLPGSTPRFELHGTIADMQAVWRQLTPDLLAVGAEAWRLLDILAGLPTVYPETVEAFVPQMLNLQLLGGISFKKGCYTGQEIVARTQHLGKLKRRMVLARVDSPTPPRPGDVLFSPHAGPSQSAGQVVDAARHPDGDYAVLAVALIEFAEQQALQLRDANGPNLRLQPLPYSFATADS